MAQPIPGASVLGWGFDIFGSYGPDSKKSQLFLLPDSGQEWTYGPTGVTYNLPQNVSVDELTDSSGTSYVFSTRSEFQEHFAAQAGVSAEYGVFSGQFEASYSNTTTDESEYSYGIYQMYNWTWRLTLQDQSLSGLAPWVKSDPDYTSLPDTFNDDNAALFFRFFDKYGAFYVSGVTVGGRLYYSVAVLKSYTTNEREINAKLNLEYDAVFSAEADSEARWEQATFNWTTNRVVSVRALGGSNEPLNIVVPAYDDNFGELFSDWLEDVAQSPVAVDFQITPIWQLFSGAKAEALATAFEAYTQDRLYVESKPLSSVIIVGGNAVFPPVERPDMSSGFQVCVLDRSNLEPIFNNFYSISRRAGWYSDWPKMYDGMYEDLSNYLDSKYLFIFATWGMVGAFFPTEKVYGLMLSCGAETGLGGWEAVFDLQESMNFKGVNYVLVGVPTRGPGTGFQTYVEGEWRALWLSGDDLVMSGDVAPTATLSVHLRDLPGDNFYEPRLLRAGAR